MDKTAYRCRKCRNEWSKAGGRPYVEPATPTGADAVWRRIHNHAGHEFFTKSGQRFSYEATQRAIDLDNTNKMIPRSDFDKALERMPVAGPGELRPAGAVLHLWNPHGPAHQPASRAQRRVQILRTSAIWHGSGTTPHDKGPRSALSQVRATCTGGRYWV